MRVEREAPLDAANLLLCSLRDLLRLARLHLRQSTAAPDVLVPALDDGSQGFAALQQLTLCLDSLPRTEPDLVRWCAAAAQHTDVTVRIDIRWQRGTDYRQMVWAALAQQSTPLGQLHAIFGCRPIEPVLAAEQQLLANVRCRELVLDAVVVDDSLAQLRALLAVQCSHLLCHVRCVKDTWACLCLQLALAFTCSPMPMA